jgi:(p)ppGpp synthase/HD superfamily hydrolase
MAEIFHQEQKRRDGKTPYVEHPIRVATKVERNLMPIALLHDAMEDSDLQARTLRILDFPEYIIEALEALTKKPKEDYMDYLARVKNNPYALAVKLADIDDNLNDAPTDKQKEKYKKALEFLKQ